MIHVKQDQFLNEISGELASDDEQTPCVVLSLPWLALLSSGPEFS